MALKRTLFVSYASQVYTALIGIVMVPVYLRYLGPEAYGLVGFFAMLQVWLQLLDLGLTPTLSRELSRFHAGVLDGQAAGQLVRSLEWIFGALAAGLTAVVVLTSPWLAVHWLNPQHIGIGEVATSVAIMGAIAGMRWLTGLYRSGLIGLEQQAWVNSANALLATLKSVGVVLVLVYVSAAPTAFFMFQCGVAALELLLFQRMLYRRLPAGSLGLWPQWTALRRVGRFAGIMAFIAGMWVVVTQLDKLILSHFLTLEDYGYFTLAVTVAGGISLLTNPLNQVLQSRFTILEAQQRQTELIELYRTTTQFTAAIMAAVAGTMAFFAEPLILAWTSNAEAAHRAAPILFWYALSNGIVGLMSLPFLLQYAYGNLRLHAIGEVITGSIKLPAVTYAAYHYGAIGAGAAWMATSLIYLVAWVPYVYTRIAPELKWSWLVKDVGAIVVPIAGVLYLLSYIDPERWGRLWISLFIVLSVVLLAGIGVIAGDKGRSALLIHVLK